MQWRLGYIKKKPAIVSTSSTDKDMFNILQANKNKSKFDDKRSYKDRVYDIEIEFEFRC